MVGDHQGCGVCAFAAVQSDGSVCAWGELMCNPGYYGYAERGLAGQWVCFGVVAQLPLAALPEAERSAQLQRWSGALAACGLVHSCSHNGRLRLMLCPALRTLLREAASCEAVSQTIMRLDCMRWICFKASEKQCIPANKTCF